MSSSSTSTSTSSVCLDFNANVNEILSTLGLRRDDIMKITKSKGNRPLFMRYLNHGATNSDSSSACPIRPSSEIVNTETSNSGIKVPQCAKAVATPATPASAFGGQIYHDLSPMDPRANYVGKLEELCVRNFYNSPMYQVLGTTGKSHVPVHAMSCFVQIPRSDKKFRADISRQVTLQVIKKELAYLILNKIQNDQYHNPESTTSES